MSTSVKFYTNNDYDNLLRTYTGAQAQSSPAISDIDSLKTGSNTWLIVYQYHNYGGDAMQVGPNAGLHDLNHVHTNRDGGDWKNQISSFVMYDHQPSFWSSGSTTPKLDLQDGKLLFAENANYEGDCRTFLANSSEGDLNNCDYNTNNTDRDMKNNITSLATATNVWLEVYDQPNYQGNVLKVPPSTQYNNLNDVERGNGFDWKNQIQSFRSFYSNSEPASWVINVDLSYFHSCYPDQYSDNTVNGTAIGYRTQDAQYRIYDPKVDYPDVNTMDATIQIDHIISASTDDHSNLVLSYNTQRQLIQISQDWSAGSAFEVPSWVIKTVDISAEVLGAVGALESAGVSEAAANEFIEVFDAACKTFNKVCQVIASLSESDGGRFYMIPVVCHTIARTSLAVSNDDNGNAPQMSFDHSQVANQLGGSWQQWHNTSGNLNKQLEYQRNGYQYRTWYQEVSIMRQQAGMLVTCKVDFERTTYDDHIVLMVGFMATGSGPQAVFAQASIQFHTTDDSDFDNILAAPCYQSPDSNADIAQEVANSLATQIADMDFGSASNNQARQTLPDIAKLNINTMIQAAH